MKTSAKLSFDASATRRRLLQRRDALLARHREIVAEEHELLEASEPDLPDVAANRTAAALLDRLDEAELVELQRINDALVRLDEGRYGTCVVCRRPIAAARLAAVPETDRCESCHNSH